MSSCGRPPDNYQLLTPASTAHVFRDRQPAAAPIRCFRRPSVITLSPHHDYGRASLHVKHTGTTAVHGIPSCCTPESPVAISSKLALRAPSARWRRARCIRSGPTSCISRAYIFPEYATALLLCGCSSCRCPFRLADFEHSRLQPPTAFSRGSDQPFVL